ncbi:MAG TPA: hypothetical protein VKP11_10875, partial [Frankiaceae bacterium]|nr:hypothetical protein [Frankiaceae bacterium]
AGVTPPQTMDAAPAASEMPEDTAEAAMIDDDSTSTPFAAAAPPEVTPDAQDAAAPHAPAATAGGGWPATDRRGPDRPFVRVDPDPRMPRRDNPLVAGLVKAMREAAIASRQETTARLQAEATARVETIRARATTETAVLRKRADDDVVAIREWSKAEIARVRQETEDRIEARKVELAGETDRHAASVDRLVDEVQSTVAAFEADMEHFFTRLLAENDPARLATLAEQAPDPPDLSGDGPLPLDMADDGTFRAEAALEADAAAEAEAEATEGLADMSVDQWPAAVLSAATRRSDAPAVEGDANGPDSTRLLVSGLTSVAGISAFKGALGQLAGVRSVSVSSGERGVFVFAVSHDPGVDLDSGVASLAGFSARITDATDDGFTVVAHEPAA